MYLSELFLDEVNEDFSVESVVAALRKCDEELNGRRKGIPGEEYLEDWDEMLAFWDVYKEFDREISEEVKASAQILALAREIREKCR